MKKVKVIIHEWECKIVEYICEVDDADLVDGEKWDYYGIGTLDGGDLGLDCEGFEATPISTKVLDEEYDSNCEVKSWEEIKEGKDKHDVELIATSRAEMIFEEILNGDMPVYSKANFSDIEAILDIGRNDSDYEIETHINHCFLNSGYKWFELKNGELQLRKLYKKEHQIFMKKDK